MALVVVGVVAAGLVSVGTPDQRRPVVAPPRAPLPMPSVEVNGVSLRSVAVELPDETSRFPEAAHVEAVDAHCTACHSPSMVLTQPPLTHEQWQATVTKMREIYKAPVPASEVPAILAYLDALSAGVPRTAGAATRVRPE